MDINFAELYGVLPGETDFSGAIERSLKDIESNKINYESLAKFIEEHKAKHPEKKEKFEKKTKLHNETNKLIIEYNKRLRDDENFPNKDEVRDWFYIESHKLIEQGASEFSFLYPEFMGSIEEFEKNYKII